MQSQILPGGKWSYLYPGKIVDRDEILAKDGRWSLTVTFDEGTVFRWTRSPDEPVEFECNRPYRLDEARREVCVLKD